MPTVGDALDRLKALDEDVETLARQVDSYGERLDAIEERVKKISALITGAINVDLS